MMNHQACKEREATFYKPTTECPTNLTSLTCISWVRLWGATASDVFSLSQRGSSDSNHREAGATGKLPLTEKAKACPPTPKSYVTTEAGSWVIVTISRFVGAAVSVSVYKTAGPCLKNAVI